MQQELLEAIESLKFYHEYPSSHSYHRLLGRLHNLLGWNDFESDHANLLENLISEIVDTDYIFRNRHVYKVAARHAQSQVRKFSSFYFHVTGEFPPKERMGAI